MISDDRIVLKHCLHRRAQMLQLYLLSNTVVRRDSFRGSSSKLHETFRFTILVWFFSTWEDVGSELIVGGWVLGVWFVFDFGILNFPRSRDPDIRTYSWLSLLLLSWFDWCWLIYFHLFSHVILFTRNVAFDCICIDCFSLEGKRAARPKQFAG